MNVDSTAEKGINLQVTFVDPPPRSNIGWPVHESESQVWRSYYLEALRSFKNNFLKIELQMQFERLNIMEPVASS